METQFGDRFRKLRVRSKLTQKDVADQLHITRQSISKWEQNISLPPLTMVLPITRILDCTLDELFSEENKN
ncbi:MAG: helix-turn-helix transcriptional regulator [Bacilli bacterium]|nr:helix-turn-helix domain-containing protein [Mollicutes bacterium]MDY3898849.1 helix-turn-helix transcriptional regulator [Bacilli bacterium]